MSMPSALTSLLLRCLPLIMAGALTLAAGPAQAQDIGIALKHESDSQQVLPVWNARSGRVEALLLLSPEAESDSPVERLLARNLSLPGVGLGVTLDDGSRLQTSLTPEINTGLALLCNQGIHVAMSLGVLGQQCLLAEVGGQDEILLPAARGHGLKLDSRWRSADNGIDLSFGLSWLEAPIQNEMNSLSLATDPVVGAFARPMQGAPLSMGELSQRQVYLDGRLALGQQRWLSLGGSVGSQQLDTLLGMPMRWDNAMVSFGVGYRGLSGRLTGRLIELPAGQGNFTGVDLGFSWRTPWQGELSFGAQNLLNNPVPDAGKWPMTELPVLEAPGGRTPYVRYKQDL